MRLPSAFSAAKSSFLEAQQDAAMRVLDSVLDAFNTVEDYDASKVLLVSSGVLDNDVPQASGSHFDCRLPPVGQFAP